MEALHRAAIKAVAAEAAAEAARATAQSNANALTNTARVARNHAEKVHHPGYSACAVAAGNAFLPAGFSEFAGYGSSAKDMLKEILHEGDSLEPDEEGERFDGGAAATWATRSHRAFLTHSVAVAAAKAAYRAVVRETDRRAQQPNLAAVRCGC